MKIEHSKNNPHSKGDKVQLVYSVWQAEPTSVWIPKSIKIPKYQIVAEGPFSSNSRSLSAAFAGFWAFHTQAPTATLENPARKTSPSF